MVKFGHSDLISAIVACFVLRATAIKFHHLRNSLQEITPSMIILRYMLLQKLYINVAIAHKFLANWEKWARPKILQFHPKKSKNLAESGSNHISDLYLKYH